MTILVREIVYIVERVKYLKTQEVNMEIRVATWNMGHWNHPKTWIDAWKFLSEEISPDILLVQEANPHDNTGSLIRVLSSEQRLPFQIT